MQLYFWCYDKGTNLSWYTIEKDIWLAFKCILAHVGSQKFVPDLVKNGEN